jgi:membrane-associated protein
MTALLDRLFNASEVAVYLIVGALVFAEDALFIGFVIPGETAALIGGVIASRGHVHLWLIALIVVAAAIIGDSVGYEVGRHLGTRMLNLKIFDKRRKRLDDAQTFLRRRGGAAIFLGRFVAFLRAVMPALAGTSRMPYLKFLVFNAAGGIAWGIGFTVLGYLAGNSYQQVAKTAGRTAALVVLGIVIIAIITWRIRKHLAEKKTETQPGTNHAGQPPDPPRGIDDAGEGSN